MDYNILMEGTQPDSSVQQRIFVKDDIYLSSQTYKGKKYIDLRKFYTPVKTPGTLTATKKGITMSPEQFQALQLLMTNPNAMSALN